MRGRRLERVGARRHPPRSPAATAPFGTVADRVVDRDRVRARTSVSRDRNPCSIASASVNALNADPACRPVPPLNVARFSCEVAKSFPPAIARMCPVDGSIATSAAPGSCGLGQVRTRSRLRRRPDSRDRARSSPGGRRRRRRPARSACARVSRTYWTKYSESPGASICASGPALEVDGDPAARLPLQPLRSLGVEVVVLHHPVQREVPPELGVERMVDRVVRLGGGEDARRAWPTARIVRRRRRHAEVGLRRRLDPVGAVPEVHRVEVLRRGSCPSRACARP